MRALNIIESAYRATLEEQDDTVVWFTRAIRNAGGDVDILLRGNAVNYGVKAQDAQGLMFGAWRQTQPPRLADDISGAIEKGIAVFLVSEDLAERGVAPADLVGGIEFVGRGEIAKLVRRYDQVWHW
jgi:predicted peroxiredoxin